MLYILYCCITSTNTTTNYKKLHFLCAFSFAVQYVFVHPVLLCSVLFFGATKKVFIISYRAPKSRPELVLDDDDDDDDDDY
jgi:hypothetical protein